MTMICAIVLAAGQSKRMGSQKTLLPLEGKPVIAHIVDALLTSRVQSVYVVHGVDGRAVKDALGKRPIEFVENLLERSEMLDSLRCGLRKLPSACEAVVIALGDQPRITSKLVDTLISAHQSTRAGIIVPVYNGKRGHPILFSSRYRDEIKIGRAHV